MAPRSFHAHAVKGGDPASRKHVRAREENRGSAMRKGRGVLSGFRNLPGRKKRRGKSAVIKKRIRERCSAPGRTRFRGRSRGCGEGTPPQGSFRDGKTDAPEKTIKGKRITLSNRMEEPKTSGATGCHKRA